MTKVVGHARGGREVEGRPHHLHADLGDRRTVDANERIVDARQPGIVDVIQKEANLGVDVEIGLVAGCSRWHETEPPGDPGHDLGAPRRVLAREALQLAPHEVGDGIGASTAMVGRITLAEVDPIVEAAKRLEQPTRLPDVRHLLPVHPEEGEQVKLADEHLNAGGKENGRCPREDRSRR